MKLRFTKKSKTLVFLTEWSEVPGHTKTSIKHPYQDQYRNYTVGYEDRYFTYLLTNPPVSLKVSQGGT